MPSSPRASRSRRSSSSRRRAPAPGEASPAPPGTPSEAPPSRAPRAAKTERSSGDDDRWYDIYEVSRESGSERGEKKRLSFASIITGATRATRGQTHGTIPNAEQSSRVVWKGNPIKKNQNRNRGATNFQLKYLLDSTRRLARELQSHFPNARARHASPFRSLPPPTRPPPRGPWTRRTAGWIP